MIGARNLDNLTIEERTLTHPCFHCKASGNARIHLPVAPKCNIQCNYCVRKFDCSNESRPGVVSKVLTPKQAAKRYQEAKAKLDRLTVAGIAGPGDPLANFEEVGETLRLIRQADPEVTFCLSTNGLMLPFYANHLISLGVSHVTVTVNAIEPITGAKIYRHINYLGQSYHGEEGAAILLQNQQIGIRYLTSMGIVVKVNIVLLKGINDHQIKDITGAVRKWGVSLTNIIPLIPVQGSAFETMEAVNNTELNRIRKKCEEVLPQMYHCRQCRADAAGTLEQDLSIGFQSNSEMVKNEPIGEIETELEIHLINELRNEFETELKDELGKELKGESETELKDELEKELKDEFEKEPKNELETELKDEFETELKDEFENELKDEFEKEPKDELENALRNELKNEFKNEFKYEPKNTGKNEASNKIEYKKQPLRFAVCSKDGYMINQHFGHAEQFYIYEYIDDKAVFAETRKTDKYCDGAEYGENTNKLKEKIRLLKDCDLVVCLRIGTAPAFELKENGIGVYTICNRIEDGLLEAAASLKLTENSGVYSLKSAGLGAAGSESAGSFSTETERKIKHETTLSAACSL